MDFMRVNSWSYLSPGRGFDTRTILSRSDEPLALF